MNQRLFLVFLAIVMVIRICEAADFEVDGIAYNVNGDGESVSVTSKIQNDRNSYCGNIIIPNSVTYNDMEYKVTSIEERAFGNCYAGLTSVVIPNTVTSIGSSAFEFCSDLKSIQIPNSVTSIEPFTFFASGLASIEIPNSVTSIGSGAFQGCYGLTSIEIPNSVSIIGSLAFAASGLTSIDIPNSVTIIDSNAFAGSSVKSVKISDSVVSIGKQAFAGCLSLTSVEIPNSVTSIGEGAFKYCNNLYAFYGKFASEDNKCLIIDGVLNSFAPYGLTAYSIPNSVKVIGLEAFEFYDALTSVEIPNTVTTIEPRAFANCSSLTSIEIPNSVTSIGESCFYYCYGLTSIQIPNSVNLIGEGSFSGCFNMSAFYGKYSSEDNRCLIINGVLNSFAPSGLTSYSIPKSVTTIGLDAFRYSYELTYIEIPNSVTSIESCAFRNCNSLKSIAMSKSLTFIGSKAFSDCYKLASIEIPNTVTSIGTEAFGLCFDLSSIKLAVDSPLKISLGEWVFMAVPDTCTLYVPKGSKELYANADQWNQFKKIEEIDFPEDGIEDIFMDDYPCQDDSYYDLYGRRVINPERGIFIHNGRKEVIK